MTGSVNILHSQLWKLRKLGEGCLLSLPWKSSGGQGWNIVTSVWVVFCISLYGVSKQIISLDHVISVLCSDLDQKGLIICFSCTAGLRET